MTVAFPRWGIREKRAEAIEEIGSRTSEVRLSSHARPSALIQFRGLNQMKLRIKRWYLMIRPNQIRERGPKIGLCDGQQIHGWIALAHKPAVKSEFVGLAP